MQISIIHSRVTDEQKKILLEALETYIKLAVDIEQGIFAAGGVLHADCEAVLITNGSKQEKIWGADWIPSSKEIRYEALINIRPKDNNPSMTVLDPDIRARIKEIVERLMV